MTGPSVLAALSRPEQRAGHALLVAAVGQLAVELVDQVAAVGEDQHAAGARGLHEAERRDRLAGAGGVLEPEPARGVGVLRCRRRRRPPPRPPRRRPSRAAPRRRRAPRRPRSRPRRWAAPRIGGRSAVAALPLREAAACDLGGERDQRAGEGVDLVGGQRRAVDEAAAPPRRAAARGRASASTRAATPPTAPRARRRAPPAPRRARGGGPCPAPAPCPRPRPRARTARARTPRRVADRRRDTGAESAREVLSAMGPLVLWGRRSGTGCDRGDCEGRRGAHRGPPSCAALACPVERREPRRIRQRRVRPYYSTRSGDSATACVCQPSAPCSPA